MDLLQLQNNSESLLVEPGMVDAAIGVEGGDEGFKDILTDVDDLIALQQKIAESSDTILLSEQSNVLSEPVAPDDMLNLIQKATEDMTIDDKENLMIQDGDFVEKDSAEEISLLVNQNQTHHTHQSSNADIATPKIQAPFMAKDQGPLKHVLNHVNSASSVSEEQYQNIKLSEGPHLELSSQSQLDDNLPMGLVKPSTAQLREVKGLKKEPAIDINTEHSKSTDLFQLQGGRSFVEGMKAADTSTKMQGINDSVLNTQATKLEQVAQQLGERVIKMHNRNVQSAEIELHPAELGKLEIQLRVEGDNPIW